MNAKRLIFFDFEGVIVDSFNILFQPIKALNPNFTPYDYRQLFLGNVHKEIERIVETKAVRWTNDEEFWAKYTKTLLGQSPFTGIPAAITELGKQYPQVIVSSTIRDPIKKYLIRYDLDLYFSEILGKEAGKKKDEKIERALTEHRILPRNSLYITDTLGDIFEAQRVGVQSIATLWGFHDEKTLRQGNPAAIVRMPREIPEVVDRYF